MSTTHVTPGRPRDPEVDRRIAQAALDLFAEAGWAGFAMEAVARRAGVGKASLYLRWNTKEALLANAVTWRLAWVADVDTGTLHGDLVELATQILDIYVGDTGRVALRLKPGSGRGSRAWPGTSRPCSGPRSWPPGPSSGGGSAAVRSPRARRSRCCWTRWRAGP